MFGHRSGDVIGQSVDILMTEDDAAHHQRAVERFLDGGGGRSIRTPRELVGKHADGRAIPIELTLNEAQVGERRWFIAVCRDISARRAESLRLRAGEERFRTAFHDAPIGMFELDAEGRIREVNIAGERLVGVEPTTELAGRSFLEVVRAAPNDLLTTDLRAVLTSVLERSSDRTPHRARQQRDPLGGDRGSRIAVRPEAAMLLQVVDITEQRQFEDRLSYLADHDPLTGLANRRSFDQALLGHCDGVSRYGAAGALLLVDLDHFKRSTTPSGTGPATGC
ncbi:MAG: PAS domain S-box protein [Ilumatobacteraceae bacterium]